MPSTLIHQLRHALRDQETTWRMVRGQRKIRRVAQARADCAWALVAAGCTWGRAAQMLRADRSNLYKLCQRRGERDGD